LHSLPPYNLAYKNLKLLSIDIFKFEANIL